jgi:hypothetical protein
MMSDEKRSILIRKYSNIMCFFYDATTNNTDLYHYIMDINAHGMFMRSLLSSYNQKTNRIVKRFNVKKIKILKKMYSSILMKVFCYDVSNQIMKFLL